LNAGISFAAESGAPLSSFNNFPDSGGDKHRPEKFHMIIQETL